MTQHIVAEDVQDDIRTFKHLRNFIAFFAAFAVCLAIGVAIFAP